jgi:hypothetical protein
VGKKGALVRFDDDVPAGESHFSVIWPLVSIRKKNHLLMDWNVLWWLVHYEHPEPDTREFRFIGGRAMALLRRRRTAGTRIFEFNPILPVYSHERINDGRSKWSVFGGLLGYENNGGERRIKIFWVKGPVMGKKSKIASVPVN